jgi:hypothetical protein
MIREAFISDHIELTEIAFLAKQGWDYPAGYIEIWKDELTGIIHHKMNKYL